MRTSIETDSLGEEKNAAFKTNNICISSYVAGWQAYFNMLGFFVLGLGFSIGHHLYYKSLKGQIVEVVLSKWDLNALKTNQEWKLRWGTAVAFLAKTMFVAAIASAYQNYTWTTIRRNAVTLKGLDAMFEALDDIRGLMSFSFWGSTRVGATLALLAWIMPLSALITPSTLTVISSVITSNQTMPVPMINFSNPDPLFDRGSSALWTDVSSFENGATPYITRIMANTASSSHILSIPLVLPNSIYELNFHGPSLRCDPQPSKGVNEGILSLLNATDALIRVDPTTGLSQPPWITSLDDPTGLIWVAAAPLGLLLGPASRGDPPNQTISEGFVKECLLSADYTNGASISAAAYGSWSTLCEGITDAAYFGPGQNNTDHNTGSIWIWAQNNTWDCELVDTEYSVSFISNGDQQQIRDDYHYKYTDGALYGSYFAIGNVLSNWLSGIVHQDGSSWLTMRSRITETSILGAFRTSALVNDKTNDVNRHNFVSPTSITADVRALARNRTVGQMVEELSRNLTLSLFSANAVLSTTGNLTTVVHQRTVNVYNYNDLNLLLSYFIASLATLVAVSIGCFALSYNGISHGKTFSSIMNATRNPSLDRLVFQEDGSPKREMARVKLRYGLLPYMKSQYTNGETQRVGIGFEDEVEALTKGTAVRDNYPLI